MCASIRSAAFAFFIALASAQAQTEIVTDRPDLTESPITVPQGSVQVEGGLLQTWDQPDALAAGALVRWGVGTTWEVRLDTPAYTRTAETSGFASPTVGAQLELGKASGWDVAAIVQTSIPTRGVFGDTWMQPLALLVAGRDLPLGLSVGTQAELGVDPQTRTASGGGTFVVGRPVGGPLSTFLELATDVEGAELSSVLVQHGYTVRLTPTLQLDAHVAFGLEGTSAPAALGGLGLSVRR